MDEFRQSSERTVGGEGGGERALNPEQQRQAAADARIQKNKNNVAAYSQNFPTQMKRLEPEIKANIAQYAKKKAEGFDVEALRGKYVSVNPTTKKFRFRKGSTPEFIEALLGRNVLESDIARLDRLNTLKPMSDQTVSKIIGTEKEYLENNPNSTKEDYQQLSAELINQKKVDAYVGKFDTPTDAIYNAVYEVADKQEKTTVADAEKGEENIGSDVDVVKELYQGLGGENAQAVLDWASVNLSAPVEKRLNSFVKETERSINSARDAVRRGSDIDELRNALRLEGIDGLGNRKITTNLERVRGLNEDQNKSFFDPEADSKNRTRPYILDGQLKDLLNKRNSVPKEDAGAVETLEVIDSKIEKIREELADIERAEELESSQVESADRLKEILKRTGSKTYRDEKGNIITSPLREEEETKIIAAKIKNLTPKEKNALKEAGGAKDISDNLRISLKAIIDASRAYGGSYLEALQVFKDLRIGDIITQLKRVKVSNTFSNKLPLKYINKLDGRVDDSVATLIVEGNLSGALLELSNTSTDKRVKQVARVLSEAVGDARVEVMESGDNYASDNIAYINQNEGTNGGLYVHTLLHEGAHIVVNNITGNKPSHPLTKQLNKLFEQVKGNLDGEYGTQDLQEFISEALSNSRFQARLAAMYPDGSPMTALNSFFRSVTNFLRRLAGMDTKPLDSALDLVDRELIAFLSTSPGTRDSGSMHGYASREGVQKLAREIGDIQKGFARPTAKEADKFNREVLDISDKIVNGASKLGIFGTFDSLLMGDVAKARGFGDLGIELHKTIQSVRGKKAESDRLVQQEITKVSKWAAKNPNEMDMLNDLIYSREYGATIYQVDPTLTRQQAKDRYVTINKKGESKYAVDKDSGKELFEVWEEQQKIWGKLGKSGGRKIYTDIRDMYKRQYKRLEQVIRSRMDEVVGDDKESAAKLKKSVYDKLFDSKSLDVYFPLARRGKYKLTYSTPVEEGADGQANRDSFVVLMFESQAERDAQAQKAISDDMLNVTLSDGEVDFNSYKNNPDGSFVNQVLSTLDKAKASPEVKQEIMDLFVKALPETSFAKALVRREGFEGYEKDAVFAMRSKAYDLGAQIERLDVMSKLYKLEDGIIEKAKDLNKDLRTTNQKSTTDAIAKDLLERVKFTKFGAPNKTVDAIARNLNQGAFIYTIGFGASSAIVNTSQLPMVVYPMLAARYGNKATMQAMTEAAGITTSSGNAIDAYFDVAPITKRDKDGNDVPTGEVSYTLKKDLPKNLEKVYGPLDVLVKRASQRSYLTQSFLADALGLDESAQTFEFLQEKLGLERAKKLPSSESNVLTRTLNSVSAISAIMFNAGEKFNRQTTLVASYNLALGDITKGNPKDKDGNPTNVTKAQKEKAADQAMDMSTQYNGGAVLETGSRLSQNSYGRVAFMYKNFGLRMYSTMLQSGKRAIEYQFYPPPNETAVEKEQRLLERNIAVKQLLGLQVTSVLLAGVQAAPLYGAYEIVREIIDFFDEDELDDPDTIARQYLTEGWYKGPLVQLLGIDFSERIRLNNLLFEENRFNYDPSLEENLFYYFGGPAFSTGKRFARGFNDLLEGEVARGIENLVPPALANIHRNTFGRYAEERSILTRRGDPIVTDLTLGDLFAGAIGFPPVEYTQEQAFKNTEQRIKNKVNEERTKILRKRNMAIEQGNFLEIREADREAVEFNKRYRRVTTNPITFESKEKSLASFRRFTTDMYNTSSNMAGGYAPYFLAKRDAYDNSSILSQLVGE